MINNKRINLGQPTTPVADKRQQTLLRNMAIRAKMSGYLHKTKPALNDDADTNENKRKRKFEE